MSPCWVSMLGITPRAFFNNARQSLWTTSQPSEEFFPFMHVASGHGWGPAWFLCCSQYRTLLLFLVPCHLSDSLETPLSPREKKDNQEPWDRWLSWLRNGVLSLGAPIVAGVQV